MHALLLLLVLMVLPALLVGAARSAARCSLVRALALVELLVMLLLA